LQPFKLLLSYGIPLLRRQIIPLRGLRVILMNAVPDFVQVTKNGLRIRVSLLCGQPGPLRRTFGVLENPVAILPGVMRDQFCGKLRRNLRNGISGVEIIKMKLHEGQFGLSLGIPQPRRAHVPFSSRSGVLPDARAFFVHPA